MELDRRIAIEAALSHARTGDVVLITGKGRRSYQIFANSVIRFDDHAKLYDAGFGRTPPRSTRVQPSSHLKIACRISKRGYVAGDFPV